LDTEVGEEVEEVREEVVFEYQVPVEEENPDQNSFSAFNQVVVDGTFMI